MSERIPIYKIGDKIKIVNYGHLLWENKSVYPESHFKSFPVVFEEENIRWVDMNHKIVGQTGIVTNVTITQGIPKYSIDPFGSWYSEQQMELLK